MANGTIKEIRARQLLDCKCRPMVEVDVVTEGGVIGRGTAPTGTSVGMYEAVVLRDNDSQDYQGLSVHKAIENIEKVIAPALIGVDVTDQAFIDKIMIELDGTSNKSRLGGNAIYPTSVACLEAAAEVCGQPLCNYLAGGEIKTIPVPCFNIVNGGKYKQFTQAFNEFMIVPYKANDIFEAVQMSILVFQELDSVISNYTGKETEVAKSYGYVAPSSDPEVVLSLMQEAVDRCGFHDRVAFALDCASSEVFDAQTRTYLLGDERISAETLINYVRQLSEKFNLVFVEDLLDENDWEYFPEAVKNIPRTIILGDDLICTNLERLKKARQMNAVGGFILKPNQVGTVTEALETCQFAKDHGLIIVPSARAGGAIGDVVRPFAVGLHCPFYKSGAPRSGERIEQLNYLMRACDLNPGSKLASVEELIRF